MIEDRPLIYDQTVEVEALPTAKGWQRSVKGLMPHFGAIRIIATPYTHSTNGRHFLLVSIWRKNSVLPESYKPGLADRIREAAGVSAPASEVEG